MAEITIKAKKRDDFSKSVLNQLRKEDYVPGVYYSRGKDPISIAVQYKDLKPVIFTSETNIVSLVVEGEETRQSIIKAIQFDPVSDKVVHFDLLGLTVGESLQLQVPVVLKGTAIGIKDGGILQNPIHKLDVECLPRYIPEHIEIDITNLKFGEAISVADIKTDNFEILNPDETIIVSVVAPKAIEVEEPEEVDILDEDQEPEVIGKGKDDEDDSEDK